MALIRKMKERSKINPLTNTPVRSYTNTPVRVSMAQTTPIGSHSRQSFWKPTNLATKQLSSSKKSFQPDKQQVSPVIPLVRVNDVTVDSTGMGNDLNVEHLNHGLGAVNFQVCYIELFLN